MTFFSILSSMSEEGPIAFELIHYKIRPTEIGPVVRSDVLFGGQPDRVYSSPGYTDDGLRDHVGRIRENRKYMGDPNVITNLKSQGMTPQIYVDKHAQRFIDEVGKENNTFYHPDSPLDFTIGDRAGEMAFNAAGPVRRILNVFIKK